jgi:hypothetical protein
VARRDLQYITTPQSHQKLAQKKAQKGHSTHVIGTESFINIKINSKQAEVLSYFSSYHMLTADVNSRRNYARMKLVKEVVLHEGP